MPIYEYRCQHCQNVFEEWLKSFDDEAPNCPNCGGTAERIMSNTTFVLKGGGWYVTEYGNKSDGGPVSAAHGDTAAGKTGDGHIEGTSTSHADAKADATPANNTPAAPAQPASPTNSTASV